MATTEQTPEVPPRQGRHGFTLIELLVVVAIIALLISILLPSLRSARALARLTVCGTNLRQIGQAIHVYANDHGGLIPRGPSPFHPFDFSSSILATNQLWIGADNPAYPSGHAYQYIGLGPLLTTIAPEPHLFYCPGDDRREQNTELDKIGTDEAAYGSYIYRQLDHLPEGAATGKLDGMGSNVVELTPVRVEALALDANSMGEGAYGRTNHGARRANIVFRDGSVKRCENRVDALAIPEQAYANFALLPVYVDQLLTNADYAYIGVPEKAPRLISSATP